MIPLRQAQMWRGFEAFANAASAGLLIQHSG